MLFQRRLKLFCFDNVHMFAFPFTCVFTLVFASISVGGIVIRSSTGIPVVFRQVSSLPHFLHVLMSKELVLVVLVV